MIARSLQIAAVLLIVFSLILAALLRFGSARPDQPSGQFVSNWTAQAGPQQSTRPTTEPPLAATAFQMQPSPGTVVPARFEVERLLRLTEAAQGSFGIVINDETRGREIYAEQRDHVFYAASLIKLPIALTLYSLANQQLLSLDEQLTVRAEDLVPGTGSLQHEPPGQTYSLRELCRRMLVESDNVASNLLLRRIGFDQVNALMGQLGAGQTRVERLFFDEEARLAGRRIETSPQDIVLVLRVLWLGELTGAAGAAELRAALAANNDRSKLPALLPAAIQVYHKSAVVPASEHDAGIVVLPSGHHYIIVVMSEELPDNSAGVRAITQISRLAYDYLARLDVQP